MDGAANEDSGDRTSKSALWVSQDTGAAEPGGLGSGKSLVQRICIGKKDWAKTKAETTT